MTTTPLSKSKQVSQDPLLYYHIIVAKNVLPLVVEKQIFSKNFSWELPPAFQLQESSRILKIPLIDKITNKADVQTLRLLITSTITSPTRAGFLSFATHVVKTPGILQSLKRLTLVMDYLMVKVEWINNCLYAIEECLSQASGKVKNEAFLKTCLSFASCLIRYDRSMESCFFESLSSFVSLCWSSVQLLELKSSSVTNSKEHQIFLKFQDMILESVILPLAGDFGRPNGNLKLSVIFEYFELQPHVSLFYRDLLQGFIKKSNVMSPGSPVTKGELVMLSFLQKKLSDTIVSLSCKGFYQFYDRIHQVFPDDRRWGDLSSGIDMAATARGASTTSLEHQLVFEMEAQMKRARRENQQNLRTLLAHLSYTAACLKLPMDPRSDECIESFAKEDGSSGKKQLQTKATQSRPSKKQRV